MRSEMRIKLNNMVYEGEFYEPELAKEIARIIAIADESFDNSGYDSYDEFIWDIIDGEYDRNLYVNEILPDVYKYIGDDYTGDVEWDCKCGLYNFIVYDILEGGL